MAEMIFAEVIGDPIAQSKSPDLHRFWLGALGIDADYRATRVAPDALASYLAEQRRNPHWRGCNVTIPHKEQVLPLLEEVDDGARAIGAVNCIVATDGRLVGRNTDIDGVAAALRGVDLAGRKASVIGAGGGARAAIHYLKDAGASISILVRDPDKAKHFASSQVVVLPLDEANLGLKGSAAIINASPMGMSGAATMPAGLLESVARHSSGATLFDMVYKPLKTPFLAVGEANGGSCVDGLEMLIGQAKTAFRLFFGQGAPDDDAALRSLLTA